MMCKAEPFYNFTDMYAEVSFGKLLQKQDNHIELPAAVVGGEGKEKLFLHEL